MTEDRGLSPEVRRQKTNSVRCLLSSVFCLLMASCGFHPQGELQLAPPLHRMYLQTSDPYGILGRNLQQYIKMSKAQLVSSPTEASTILVILRDESSQNLLSVSGTQQTRQYELKVTVAFEIEDAKRRTIVPLQTISETRTITVQSNQILGSSNEAELYYQQMRHTIASAIMTRIASPEITHAVMNAFPKRPARHNQL